MKYYIYFLILISSNVMAFSSPSECGRYLVKGRIEKNINQAGYSLLVNQGSMSQFSFKISSNIQHLIVPFVDRSTKAQVRFFKPISGYQGEINAIDKIEFDVVDPLKEKTTNGLTLIRKEECRK